MSIYDTTGQVGQAKAKRQYFLDLQEIEHQKAGKAASRKLGFAGAKGAKTFLDFMGPDKLTVDSASIFEPTTGNLFERVGQRLGGVDLTKAELTKEATTAGYEIGKGRFSLLGGKPKTSTVLYKGGKEVSTQFGGPGSKVGGVLGAYQMGSGLATAFDPYASPTRKTAGAVNTALGANALLGTVGLNLWNPFGWAALGTTAVASLADIFG